MLTGISPYLSPNLLKTLCEMGHGDEFLLADAHFPGPRLARSISRADGISVSDMLNAILPLLALDVTSAPATMMQPDAGDFLDPAVELDFLRAIHRYSSREVAMVRIDRDAFYERAAAAYAVVMTGEQRAYGNILLRKGITPA